MRYAVVRILPVLFVAVTISLPTYGAVIVGDTLRNIDADNDGFVDDLPIFKVGFTVTAGTTVTFDSLVRELSTGNFFPDGFQTGFDNYMILFNSSNTALSSNDDYSTGGPLNQDGSIHHYDSVIQYLFGTAGNYYITVGQLFYNNFEAIQGYDQDRGFFDYESIDGQQDYAPWQLTLTATGGTLSNVSILNSTNAVPEPHSMAIWSLACAGCLGFGYRTRRRNR